MREIRDTQMRLEFYKSESKLSKKLEKVSEILDKNISFLERISEDFKAKKESNARAKGMTVEQVVRVAIIKQMYQLGYEKLYNELNDNLSYRSFVKIHEGMVPKRMTLNEKIKPGEVEAKVYKENLEDYLESLKIIIR